MLNKSPNINILWARLIVEELIRHGIDYFCIAPGSRSAPLAIAVSENPKAQTMVHFDERGLAFHALGYTAATKKPAVVITTSGTAAANLFPGIIEASKKKLPMIILTADRPPELRSTGANQSIDQIKIFGEYVRFYFDMPCPTPSISPKMVLTTMDQAIFRSQGEIPGPVHLNCMFRDPLTPAPTNEDFTLYLSGLSKWLAQSSPYTTYSKGQISLQTLEADRLAKKLKNIKNGIIIVGKIAGIEDQKAVLTLAKKLAWPVFPDLTSGLRLGYKDSCLIQYFDQILLSQSAQKLPLDAVLHLGGRITSQRLAQYIREANPAEFIMVLKHPLRNDPDHHITTRVQAGIGDFCSQISKRIKQRNGSALLKTFQKANDRCERVLNKVILHDKGQLTEPSVARIISKLAPANSGLFMGNSMPIRDMDMFAAKSGKSLVITANRGASGIDGNIAAAAGFAKGLGRECTAIIGDLTFLHDLNSLAMIKDLNQPFVLVVLNNNGGAIFSFLPISGFKQGFEKFVIRCFNVECYSIDDGIAALRFKKI